MNSSNRSKFFVEVKGDAIGIDNGDVIHNLNAFDYLSEVCKAIHDNFDELRAIYYANNNTKAVPIPQYLYDFYMENNSKFDKYNPNTAYGNIYKEFIENLEKHAENLRTLRNSWLSNANEHDKLKDDLRNLAALDKIIDVLFANPNKVLERCGEIVNNELQASADKKALDTRLNHISADPKEKGKKLNEYTPALASALSTRAAVNMPIIEGTSRFDCKFWVETNVPEIRNYKFQTALLLPIPIPIEVRMSTQVYVENGVCVVNPLFLLWLQSKKITRLFPTAANTNNPIASTGIDHVYFNYLPYSKEPGWTEREKWYTNSLHNIADDNLAMITLPADESGLFHHSFVKEHRNVIVIYREDAEKLMRVLASENQGKAVFEKGGRAFGALSSVPQNADLFNKSNFHIDDKIRKKLFGEIDGKVDVQNQTTVLNDLIKKSFKALNLSNSDCLTAAELQAVYFHFTKFILPKHILKKLRPTSFNMSCKDAIDRSGISSAYFNLISSLRIGNEMEEDEFNQALHAAPLFVKGRAINHHFDLLCNAIKSYSAANPTATWWNDWMVRFNVESNLCVKASDIIKDKIAPFEADLVRYYETKKGGYPISDDAKMRACKKILACLRDAKQSEHDPLTSLTAAELKGAETDSLGDRYRSIKQSFVLKKSHINILEQQVRRETKSDEFILALQDLQKYHEEVFQPKFQILGWGFHFSTEEFKERKEAVAVKMLVSFQNNEMPELTDADRKMLYSRLGEHYESLLANMPFDDEKEFFNAKMASKGYVPFNPVTSSSSMPSQGRRF